MMIAYCFFLGNPQSNNLQSDSTSSQAIAEASQSQPTFGPSLALTTGGEEVLSFNYEGIGSDVIVRKNRTFIMRVYYGDKSEGKGYSWEVPALFQYFKTEGMSDGVDGKIVDPFISAAYYSFLKPRPVWCSIRKLATQWRASRLTLTLSGSVSMANLSRKSMSMWMKPDILGISGIIEI